MSKDLGITALRESPGVEGRHVAPTGREATWGIESSQQRPLWEAAPRRALPVELFLELV